MCYDVNSRDFKARYVVINIKNRFKIPKEEKEAVR